MHKSRTACEARGGKIKCSTNHKEASLMEAPRPQETRSLSKEPRVTCGKGSAWRTQAWWGGGWKTDPRGLAGLKLFGEVRAQAGRGGLAPAPPWVGSSAGEAERAAVRPSGGPRSEPAPRCCGAPPCSAVPAQGAAFRAVLPGMSRRPFCEVEEMERVVSHGLCLPRILPIRQGRQLFLIPLNIMLPLSESGPDPGRACTC